MKQHSYRPSGHTILIADAGDGYRGLPRFLLRRHGYRVLEALHGLEALFLARRSHEPIDILIAEESCRFLTGRELADQLRQQNPYLKTILLKQDDGSSAQPRVSAYLPRKCSADRVLRTVSRLLNPQARAMQSARDLLSLDGNISINQSDRTIAARIYAAGLS